MAEVLAGSRTAFHESGHAVVTRALGYRILDIDFRGDANASAYVRHEPTKSAFDNAVIGLAGCAAVLLKFGDEFAGMSAGDVIGLEALSKDDLRAAAERSVEVLGEHWAEVEKLAHELYPTRQTTDIKT